MEKLFKKTINQKIIQGGMGVGVSNYILVRTVSALGELGVVSGVMLDAMMTRRLQNGDLTGEIRHALEQFPNQNIADWIINKYFIKNGKPLSQKYLNCPFPKFDVSSEKILTLKSKNLEKLIVAANFVEVYLAKQGHNNPVGINYLHKIQWPIMPSIYGAMLAGVDVLLIGAGFPKEIPSVINSLSKKDKATMSMPVINGENYLIEFNPLEILSNHGELNPPKLFGIVSNHLGVKALPDVDGYIFENYTAGGHNAPSRIKKLTDKGEPDYGIKDEMDYKLLKTLLEKNAKKRNNILQPYWFAGSYADKLSEVLKIGATGIQVGTPFAFCQESGIEPKLKQKTLQEILSGGRTYTDPFVSPSGFPFKVFQSPGTISCQEIYKSRKRVCNLGYLVELYEKDNVLGTRCPAENIENYVRKGGDINKTINKACLCNALFAKIGLSSPNEMPIITTGYDFSVVKLLVKKHGLNYTAKNVVDYILQEGN